VGTRIPVSTGKLAQCRLKESVFHLMLQINVAPNIGQKLSSNQWHITLGTWL